MATKARKKFRSEVRHTARQERKKRTAAAMPPVVHDGELLTVETDQKSDVSLITQAVEERWPVKLPQMETLVTRLVGIAEKTTVTIPCGEGVFESEAVADANAVRASALLKAMVDANAKSTAAKSNPQTTINVGVSVDNRTNERRDRLIALGERFRSGGVLESGSSGSD